MPMLGVHKRKGDMYIKLIKSTINALAITLSFSNVSVAELFDRGDGLIYDNVLDITWLQNANLAASNLFGLTYDEPLGYYMSDNSGYEGYIYSFNNSMNWPGAMFWIDAMNTANYLGFNDWRLPDMDKNNDGTVVVCATSTESECQDNEFGHLYYYGTGTTLGSGITSSNPDPFINVLNGYLSSTEHALNTKSVWNFRFNYNYRMDVSGKNSNLHVWAVRSGDVITFNGRVWNLATDWSDLNNPNGPWSLKHNASDISTHVSSWNGGSFHTSQSAWVVNNNTAQVPNFFKRSGTGGTYDIPLAVTAGHSPGSAQGISSVVWTSPDAMNIEVSGAIWDASPLQRVVQWDLFLNGSKLSGGVLANHTDAFSSINPFDFTITPFSVNPGDQLSLAFRAPSGQQWGDVLAFDLTISETQEIGPIGYWSGNNTANDSTINANHGTLMGDATFAPGIIGEAFSLDGEGDHVSIPDNPLWTFNGDFSINLWVNLSAHDQGPIGGPGTVFVGHDTGAGDKNKWFFAYGGGVLNFFTHDANVGTGTTTVLAETPFNPVFNEWYNLTVVRSGSVFSIYVNGVLGNSETSNVALSNASAPLTIGRAENFYAEGLIDELALYDRALSELEIQNIYNNSFSAPIANAGVDQSISVGSVVTLDASGSTDPDGTYPLSYSWMLISKPVDSIAILSKPNIINPSFTADLVGDYAFQLTVTDSAGFVSESDTVIISTYNTPPIADAGRDKAINHIGTTVFLDGTQSYDDEGHDVDYLWTLISKPVSSLASLDDPTISQPSFITDIHGEYVVSLVVTDTFGAASSPSMVTISFENIRPVANAGVNQTAIAGDIVFLDGSGSADANLDPLTYSWWLVSFPTGSQAALDNPNVFQTNFVADLPGTYIVSLVVNDGFVNSNSSNITVTAISVPSTVTNQLTETISVINSLDLSVLKNNNLQNTLTNKISSVLSMVDLGEYQQALDKLQNDILGKTNGCRDNGSPDKNDWIIDCFSQGEINTLVINTIELLARLI